ncbi:hypothetical protein CC79DRAFT_1399866 [Sarocladium strictum]
MVAIDTLEPSHETCDSIDTPQWTRDSDDNLICHERVRVITIKVGPEPVHPLDCDECENGELHRILAQVDCDKCVTAIEPYYGASKLSSPSTTTVLGDDGRTTVIVYTNVSNHGPHYKNYPTDGTGDPTIVVETPKASILGDYITITFPYTGTSSITRPITRTVPPREDEPGTVIIETPVTDRSTRARSSSGRQTVPPLVTSTDEEGNAIVPEETTDPAVPTSETEGPETDIPETEDPATEETTDPEPTPDPTPPPTPTTEPEPEFTTTGTPAGPTFDCDEGGYLIQQRTLYRLDLTTGDNPAISTRVGPGGNINAIGFNILDGYLYAFDSIGDGEQQLIRIGADGTYDLLDLIVENGLMAGDIDEAGQMWASNAGRRWLQVDLNPDSSNFGEVVDQGKSENGNVADWVYLENGGDYLYSIRIGATRTAARWSRTSHEWENLRQYPADDGQSSGFGALYAVGDELWGSNNQSGDIIAFPVLI